MRRCFGLSRPEAGRGIVYHAAAEQLYPDESVRFALSTLSPKKGAYVTKTLYDFYRNPSAISVAFNQLLAYPGIDPQGYCVESYTTVKDVRCKVRLA